MVGKKHSSSFQTVAEISQLKVPVIINKAIMKDPWLLVRDLEKRHTYSTISENLLDAHPIIIPYTPIDITPISKVATSMSVAAI
jgi:hypothetical protein